jgi:hypothetical protein
MINANSAAATALRLLKICNNLKKKHRKELTPKTRAPFVAH